MKVHATGTLAKSSFAIIVLLGLSACAEIADVLLDGTSHCIGCDWIIQEWDNPGWSTHNSDPYDTEELCEQALAAQSRRDPDRGHRCIYEGDLWPREEASIAEPAAYCHRCDWVLEAEHYAVWERVDATTYRTEGVCQQALWRLHKKEPDINYRCSSLDF